MWFFSSLTEECLTFFFQHSIFYRALCVFFRGNVETHCRRRGFRRRERRKGQRELSRAKRNSARQADTTQKDGTTGTNAGAGRKKKRDNNTV